MPMHGVVTILNRIQEVAERSVTERGMAVQAMTAVSAPMPVFGALPPPFGGLSPVFEALPIVAASRNASS